mgnify:CR=1 FL=1|tara:strand:- start:110 stop:328 length:219 start_codon:yes stop_codon:yes gene_type:complete
MLFNNLEKSEFEKVLKEYNFGEHKQNVIEKCMKKYGNVHNAVFEMEARISSLQLENDTLREMVDWDKLEEEC